MLEYLLVRLGGMEKIVPTFQINLTVPVQGQQGT
jgi:hypothetical protein